MDEISRLETQWARLLENFYSARQQAVLGPARSAPLTTITRILEHGERLDQLDQVERELSTLAHHLAARYALRDRSD